ncbi:hypothetical protein KEJ21_06890 [Candidatus Bathyarchaeota archaeon]|nr:hypothetical protein [Candidatus Bathyarchaeota archaeon]MBS7631557.1 hypothetical protein [Candidatus Bathyarchaeota archaeon]
MVREKKLEHKVLFICEECGLGYHDRETAEKCEEYCRNTKTCSLEIIKKAVKI